MICLRLRTKTFERRHRIPNESLVHSDLSLRVRQKSFANQNYSIDDCLVWKPTLVDPWWRSEESRTSVRRFDSWSFLQLLDRLRKTLRKSTSNRNVNCLEENIWAKTTWRLVQVSRFLQRQLVLTVERQIECTASLATFGIVTFCFYFHRVTSVLKFG